MIITVVRSVNLRFGYIFYLKGYGRWFWTNLDLELPVRGEDIEGFKKLVNWNGYRRDHQAFDFAAYINNEDECVLGLPPETPVRAVGDGKIVHVSKGIDGLDEYLTTIKIEHSRNGEKFLSEYHHTNPDYDLGTYGKDVKKEKK